MKLPNGYGNVSKLPGNRRRPYRARVTTGWKADYENGTVKQLYKTVGYYATRTEALNALANYNQNPYDLDASKATFADVFQRWSEDYFRRISESNAVGYTAAFKTCEQIHDMRFADIRLTHLQGVVDDSGKNYPTLKKIRILFNQMFRFAMENDICPKNYAQYVDISRYKDRNPNAYNREPFSAEEIRTLWNWKDSNEYFTVILMLVYTGVRIGEMLDLKKESVNLEERWFDVTASKTQAGIRKVPIARKVMPFFEHWMIKNDCEYLLSTPDGEHFLYRNYYDSYWIPLMNQTGMHHRPHDTRHTCVSLLTAAGVDDKIIKKIVGHKGQGVTETVYTHFEMEQLLEAVDRI